MLVFVSSTVSLPMLVCASVEGGLEGVDSLGTGISSGDVCFAVCFSATGFRCTRLRRTIGSFHNICDRGSSSLPLTSAVVQVFEDGLYTATACPDDKSSSSLLCLCPCCWRCDSWRPCKYSKSSSFVFSRCRRPLDDKSVR